MRLPLLIASLFLVSVLAAEPAAEVPKKMQLVDLVAAPFVRTACSLPGNEQRELVAGEEVQVVVGVRNSGERPLTLTSVQASLHHPLGFKYHVQNYTWQKLDLAVAPSEELSIPYSFTPDVMLESRAYTLFVGLIYNDGESNFSSPIFNATVAILEPASLLDGQGLFFYLTGLAVVALLGFFGFKMFTKLQKGSAPGVRTSATPAKKSGKAETNEWLVGTSVDPAYRRRR
eukprot:TRINITY_DN6114_c0_g1_i1.p1 TRINITY_DN6114_c0_g1~~TRINITY_DN6114_c0_g1_i1.p1  ORF type:complete len:230 (-),score=62.36 TRINITY_DN6114_c0_g1_i1:130-819(-)